jgi:hypothetical protein
MLHENFPKYTTRKNGAFIPLKAGNGYVHALRVPADGSTNPAKNALSLLERLWPFEVTGSNGKPKVTKAGKQPARSWKTLLSSCEVFRERWMAQRMRSPIQMTTEFQGGHSGITRVDFLCDFQSAVRAALRHRSKCYDCYKWLFMSSEVGTENWAYSVGRVFVQHGIDRSYFAESRLSRPPAHAH